MTMKGTCTSGDALHGGGTSHLQSFENSFWNKILCRGRAWSIQERPETEVRYGILQGPYWKNTEANGLSTVEKIFV
jgi:hypothetical protein